MAAPGGQAPPPAPMLQTSFFSPLTFARNSNTQENIRQQPVPEGSAASSDHPISSPSVFVASNGPVSPPMAHMPSASAARHHIEIRNDWQPNYLQPNESTNSLSALLARRTHDRHDHVWVRRRAHKGARRRRRSPVHQRLTCLIVSVIFATLLTTYLVLTFNSSLPTAINAIFITLCVLTGLLAIWLNLRFCLSNRQGITLQHTHRSRRRHLGSGNRRRHHHHRREGRKKHRHAPHLLHLEHPDIPAADHLPEDDAIYSPVTPIRVHLFRDEEGLYDEEKAQVEVLEVDLEDTGQGGDDEDEAGEQPLSPISVPRTTPTFPPPAYGQWRCSVRADPTLLHWQPRCSVATSENGASEAASPRSPLSPNTVPRPPSYASDVQIGITSPSTADPRPARRSMAAEEAARLSRPTSRRASVSVVETLSTQMEVTPEDTIHESEGGVALQEATRILLMGR